MSQNAHARATASSTMPKVTIGLDLGDRTSRTYEVNADGHGVGEATVRTSLDGLTQYFGGRERCRGAPDGATHSPWISRLLTDLGHEVIVANPSAMFAG